MMTQSSVDEALAYRLARVRDLTQKYLAGRWESHWAFRELVDLLLRATVMQPSGIVQLQKVPREKGGSPLFVIGGPDLKPLPLNDGRFLRLIISIYIDKTDGAGPRLKVDESAYQYQGDEDGNEWIVRYDYLRHPPDPHPGSHLQINGDLRHPDCLPDHGMLQKIHFPTYRVSLEAVIRMLADQFNVPCNNATSVWRALLTESERTFLGIFHKATSGPAR